MNIGERLKTMRKLRNVKGVELARQTGISPSNLSLIENGKKNATIDTIEKIVEALDCKIVIIPSEF